MKLQIGSFEIEFNKLSEPAEKALQLKNYAYTVSRNDCVNFILQCFNIKLVKRKIYEPFWWYSHNYLEEDLKILQDMKILYKVETPLMNDLIVCKFKKKSFHHHLGIVLNSNEFISAYDSGVHIDKIERFCNKDAYFLRVEKRELWQLD